MKKKGVSLASNVIVYFILALLVLILLVFLFQDQLKFFLDKLGFFFNLAEGGISK
jgi:hypothetical protein|tara:strand:+ start:475 stop:639 length:165 start_codon:yes stop_codon:yes gene_type:complete